MALITWVDVIKNIEINTGRNSQRAEGFNDVVSAEKLIDNDVDFTALGLVENMIVKNRTTAEYSYIVSVDDANTITIADDIFTSTNQKYYIYDYQDMNVLEMQYHINLVIGKIFDKMRVLYSDPETDLVNNATIKLIAIDIATCRIGKKIYRFFSGDALEQLNNDCEKAEKEIDKIISGDIILNVDGDETEDFGFVEEATGGAIFQTTSDDDTQNEYWGNIRDEYKF